VRRYIQNGFAAIGGEKGAGDNGTVSFDITATGNTATEPESKVGAGFRTEAADPASTVNFCFDLKENALSGSATIGTDIRVFHDFAQNTFRLPGYAGGSQDGTAVGNYFLGRNTATTKLATTPGSGSGYTSIASCTQPPA